MNRICTAAGLALITSALIIPGCKKAEEAQADAQKKASAAEQPAGNTGTGMRSESARQFDKDGDGKLSAEEHKAMIEKIRADRQKVYDKNGDGKLDDAEKAAATTAQTARIEQLRKAREKAFDKNGDGKLDEQERAQMIQEFQKNRPDLAAHMQSMLKQFDKNGDGKLDEQERRTLLEERTKFMGQQVPQGGAPAVPQASAPAAASVTQAPAAK